MTAAGGVGLDLPHSGAGGRGDRVPYRRRNDRCEALISFRTPHVIFHFLSQMGLYCVYLAGGSLTADAPKGAEASMMRTS